MEVDSGLGDLEAVFTVSCYSVNWDKVIKWCLDAPALALKRVMSLDLALRSKRGCHDGNRTSGHKDIEPQPLF